MVLKELEVIVEPLNPGTLLAQSRQVAYCHTVTIRVLTRHSHVKTQPLLTWLCHYFARGQHQNFITCASTSASNNMRKFVSDFWYLKNLSDASTHPMGSAVGRNIDSHVARKLNGPI
jgi:hypothetical protein